MEYDVDAQVGGKIAMLGSRLVDSTAQSLANQFFDKFATVVNQSAAASKKPKPKAAKKPAKKPAAKKPVKAKKVAAKATKKPAKKKR
jgi:hypothetical protein